MIRPRAWAGESLTGVWRVTVKVDGIRALWTPDGYVSRNGKPLRNLEKHAHLRIPDMEVFMGSLSDTVTALRSHDSVDVPREALYQLSPDLDPRLLIADVTDPSRDFIEETLERVASDGHEGLVLRRGDSWLKVKKTSTYDVPVTGVIEGTGKYVGVLGAFETPMGRVGTGFTDEQRRAYFTPSVIGTVIEVVCMEVTGDGKFRHPRFIRERWDKNEVDTES